MRWWMALAFVSLGCGGEDETRTEGTGTPALPADCEPLSGLPRTLLVDDFEDGDGRLDARAGLSGFWYVENDGTGTQQPSAEERAPEALLAEPGAPDSTAHSLHTSGRGFTRWGAFVGVRLNAAQSRSCTADVSASRGLAFTARGQGGLRVNFASPTTTPVGDGGECGGQRCSDFGATVMLTNQWSPFEVSFEELEQPDWAEPAEWQPQRLVRLSFWAEQSDFELWLDEVRFD